MLCDVCPRMCHVDPGEVGACGVRGNVAGRIELLSYGRVTTAVCGSIEDKPIYHFRPGSRTLSIGGSGCNMSCGYCQNFEISQALASVAPVDALGVINMAHQNEAEGIAFTYSEPIVWFEYVMDVAREAMRAGLYTVLKTNGYATPRYFGELCSVMDAVNVDIKGSGVMLENLRLASSRSHMELSMVVWAGIDVGRMVDTLREFSGHPLHLLPLVPDFRMRNVIPPSLDYLRAARSTARKVFHNVYVKHAAFRNDTTCECGEVLASRRGSLLEFCGLNDGACPCCGAKLCATTTSARSATAASK